MFGGERGVKCNDRGCAAPCFLGENLKAAAVSPSPRANESRERCLESDMERAEPTSSRLAPSQSRYAAVSKHDLARGVDERGARRLASAAQPRRHMAAKNRWKRSERLGRVPWLLGAGLWQRKKHYLGFCPPKQWVSSHTSPSPGGRDERIQFEFGPASHPIKPHVFFEAFTSSIRVA